MTEAHNVRATISDRFGLTHDAIFRLLNTAIKDDEKLVDEAIAAVYDQMISFDRARADRVISLIIRRHREAKDAFKTLLRDASERQPKNLQLRVAWSATLSRLYWRPGDSASQPVLMRNCLWIRFISSRIAPGSWTLQLRLRMTQQVSHSGAWKRQAN
jgi:hypothetical protein